MKNKLLISFFLLLLSQFTLFLMPCTAQNACQANYTKTVNQATKTVVFTNTSTPAGNYYYYWTFGNGTSSTSTHATVTYAHSGKYQVCLHLMKTDSSCSSVKCDSIEIGNSTPVCNANFTKIKDPSNPKKYYFEAQLNDTNYRYQYTFGDGTGSDARTTYHIWSNYGTYVVCLRVTKKDSSCTFQKCDTLTLSSNTQYCNANWSKQVDPSNSKKLYFIPAMSDTAFRYLWTFGDGTSSDSKTTYHSYNHSGKYYVCLKVMKKDSSCQQTKCDSVWVGALPCNAAFSKMVSNSLPRTYSFEALTNDTGYWYQYSFGDSTFGVGRFQTHTYAANGTYTVCLKVTKKDSSCTKTECLTLTLGSSSNCNANFNIIKSDSIGANPHYVRFTDVSTGVHSRCIYQFGDGTSSDNCNPIHYFSTLGSKTVCLTIYKIENHDTLCKSTTCKTFNTANSNPVTCVAVFDYERIGSSSTYRFINRSQGSPLQYRWVFDGGAPITSTHVEHDFVTAGMHVACLYVVNTLDTNCKSSFCVSILFPGNVIGPQQCVANFDVNPDPIAPATYQFNSQSGNAVQNLWNFGDGGVSYEGNATHTYNQNGQYYVCLHVLNTSDSCSDMRCDSIMVSGATGISEQGIQLSEVYPVPVDQTLNIRLGAEKSGEARVSILNLNGQKISSEAYHLQKGNNHLEINLSTLPNGIYLLQVQNGEQSLIRRIVK